MGSHSGWASCVTDMSLAYDPKPLWSCGSNNLFVAWIFTYINFMGNHRWCHPAARGYKGALCKL